MTIRTGEPPVVRVTGVRKAFGPVQAIDGVDLALSPGETLALLGPSGCGKTTLLRTIAGLERPDAGRIEIRGRVVDGDGAFVPPERRGLGMVFQDVALFPHLSVAENVRFGIATAPDRHERVAELLDLVGLPDAGAARPHELSGGMQQRVALARALAPRPEVVLLDEPFAALDLGLRTQLRAELRRILDRTGAAALLVTHDQAEALTVADRVAVMRRGVVDQVDTPEVIYAQPATPFVATFVGVANLVPATLHDGMADTVLGATRLSVSPGEASRGLVLVRPEHVELAAWPDDDDRDPDQTDRDPDHPGGALVAARILARRFAGAELHYEVELASGLRLWVEAGPAARRLHVGDPVGLALRPVESVAFAASHGTG